MTQRKLSPFVTAYLEAMFWTEEDELSDKDFADLSDEAMAQVQADCDRFQEENEANLSDLDDAQCGHDFWLTRNRHGVGFRDRGYPKGQADALTNSANAAGEVWVYVGDDGKVWLSK